MSGRVPISIRLSEAERGTLQRAADLSRTSLSDYIRRVAMDAVETVLLRPQPIVISDADWAGFTPWVERPPEDSPALRDLAASERMPPENGVGSLLE